jgi:integrase-like protein
MPGPKTRHFGNIRRRESGRYQVRYRGPDGRMWSGPYTFARKSEAVRWLTLKEAEMKRGDWIDPASRAVLFGEYAEEWVHDRVLKTRTVKLYRGLLRNHLLPTFCDMRLGDISRCASLA